MGQHLTFERHDLDSFDGLQKAVKGTHFDIVQLGRGRLQGSISYLGIDEFALSFNSFSVGVCAQRTSADDKIMVGVLLNASDRVTQWSYDMVPGDIVVIPPESEHHAVHRGGCSYAVIRLDPDELPDVFGDTSSLSDPENWRAINRHRTNPGLGMSLARCLPVLADQLGRRAGVLLEGTAEFWKRAIIECMITPIRSSLPPDEAGHLRSALKIVQQVKDHLQTAGNRPLHISELCSKLHLSRRTLHRAFHEVLGVGPVTFLRQRRLCAVYSMLRARAPKQTTVADAAMQFGFVELGRFSRDYRVMFGEYPSQTLGMTALPTPIGTIDADRLADVGSRRLGLDKSTHTVQ